MLIESTKHVVFGIVTRQLPMILSRWSDLASPFLNTPRRAVVTLHADADEGKKYIVFGSSFEPDVFPFDESNRVLIDWKYVLLKIPSNWMTSVSTVNSNTESDMACTTT